MVDVPSQYTFNCATSSVKARKSVVDMLVYANNCLPNGYSIRIVEAYRSIERQTALWNSEKARLGACHPEFSVEDLNVHTSRRIARPTTVGGGHQTGGAVDVMLLYRNLPVDMGTGIQEFNKKTATSSRAVSPSRKVNRKILQKAMRQAGFANYPAEWWHYSYGDKMWAAYVNKPYAIYDVLRSIDD